MTDDTGADVTGLGVVGTIAASEGASIIVRLGEKVIGKRLTPDMTHAIKDVFIAEVFRQYKAVGRRGKLATLRQRIARPRRSRALKKQIRANVDSFDPISATRRASPSGGEHHAVGGLTDEGRAIARAVAPPSDWRGLMAEELYRRFGRARDTSGGDPYRADHAFEVWWVVISKKPLKNGSKKNRPSVPHDSSVRAWAYDTADALAAALLVKDKTRPLFEALEAGERKHVAEQQLRELAAIKHGLWMVLAVLVILLLGGDDEVRTLIHWIGTVVD